MTKPNWKEANFADQHVLTRFACHGFHRQFCNNKKNNTGMLKQSASVNFLVSMEINTISKTAKKNSLREAERLKKTYMYFLLIGALNNKHLFFIYI